LKGGRGDCTQGGGTLIHNIILPLCQKIRYLHIISMPNRRENQKKNKNHYIEARCEEKKHINRTTTV